MMMYFVCFLYGFYDGNKKTTTFYCFDKKISAGTLFEKMEHANLIHNEMCS